LDILGVGPLEIVVILVIALLVFGPDKLPEIGAKLGQSVRELRNLSREITREVDTVREAVAGPVEELSRPFQEANQIVQQVSQAAEAVHNPGQALEKALVGQLAPAKAAAPKTENTIAPPEVGAHGAAVPASEVVPAAGSLPPAAAGPSELPANAPSASDAPVPEEDAIPAPAAPSSPEASDQSWEI
jgi:TatA/E family protein of Tat protein translocase